MVRQPGWRERPATKYRTAAEVAAALRQEKDGWVRALREVDVRPAAGRGARQRHSA